MKTTFIKLRAYSIRIKENLDLILNLNSDLKLRHITHALEARSLLIKEHVNLRHLN